MALNFSPSSLFSTAERGFGSPIRERSGDGFRRGEEAYDIVDLLPDDPFGMNVESSTLTAAIAGWIEDLKEEYVGGEWGLDKRYDGLQEFDYYWTAAYFSPEAGFSGRGSSCDANGVMDLSRYLPYTGSFGFSLGGSGGGALGSDWMEDWSWHPGSDCRGADPLGSSLSKSCGADLLGSSLSTSCCADPLGSGLSTDCGADSIGSGLSTSYDDFIGEVRGVEEGFSEQEEVCAQGSSSAEVGGLPHDGMLFALKFLDVKGLLTVEMVCKTLHSAVRSDPYLWSCMHIDDSLNNRLTDEALLQLSQRAHGNVQCLSLVDCSKVTNDGLKRVLEDNGKITQLNLHGCVRLTVEGLLDSFKPLKTPGHPPMKHVMIGGIFASSEEHYEDLISLLDLDISQNPVDRRPRFFHLNHSSPTCDYDRVLDIELCPKCQSWRLLYDCPAESCQAKDSEPCKACTICIPRCGRCGRCVTNDVFVETFYLDYLCSVCMNHLCQTQEGYEASFGKVSLPSSSVPASDAAAHVAEQTAVE